MRRRLLVCSALAAFVLLATGVAGALDGDPPGSTGWWSSQPGATAQPNGGFEVASAAGQPVAVAAVRFSTPSGVTSATLTLQESGGFVTPASALQVCTTTGDWKPANPGASADQPKSDCTQAIALTRDATKLTWTADVAPLLPALGGEPSLMIVPGTTPGGGSPLDPGFQVDFSGAALAVVAAPGTTTTAFSSGSTDFGGGTSGSGSSSFGSGSSGSIGGIGPVTPTTVAAPATSTTVTPVEAFKPQKLAAGATPGGGGGGADQPWERLLLLVPISAAAGVGTVFARKLLAQRGIVEAG